MFPNPLTGGWWLSSCGETNLNGRYLWLRGKGRSMRRKGLHWKPGTGSSYSLKMTKITIRQATDADSSNWIPQLTATTSIFFTHTCKSWTRKWHTKWFSFTFVCDSNIRLIASRLHFVRGRCRPSNSRPKNAELLQWCSHDMQVVNPLGLIQQGQ